MLVAPLASIGIEHALRPDVALLWLVGKWFVFWSVGARLALAGLRQLFQPAYTATQIFHMKSDEALPVVRELGVANLATGVVGLTSLAIPTFVLPAALSAGIFYALAGVRHARERGRSRNETIAMLTDLFMGAVLGVFVIGSLA